MALVELAAGFQLQFLHLLALYLAFDYWEVFHV